MRVLMVHPHDVFHPSEPWTIRIQELAQEIVSQGHEVSLVYFSLHGFKEAPFTMEGVNYIPLSRKANPIQFLKRVKFFSSLVREHDLVSIQKCFHYASVPVAIAAWIEKKWMHFDWDDHEEAIYFSGGKVPSWWVGKSLGFLERSLVRLANSISVSSDYLWEQVKKIRGAQYRQVVKVWVGGKVLPYDIEKVEGIKKHYSLGDKSLIYAGQLHGAQYVEMLIKAMSHIQKTYKEAKLIIVGDGYDRPRLEKLSEEMGLLEKNIYFTGSLSRSHMAHYLKACRIAVACFEDNQVTRAKTPLKIAEYIGAEKAILANSVGEVQKMLGSAGIVINTFTPQSLAEAILSLFNEPEKISDLESKARERKEDLSWKRSGETLIRFWEEALKEEDQ